MVLRALGREPEDASVKQADPSTASSVGVPIAGAMQQPLMKLLHAIQQQQHQNQLLRADADVGENRK